MGPLPLTLLLILASPSCLGMRTHSLDATRHHAEHPGSDQGSSVGPDHPHRYPPYMMQLYQHYKSVDMKETGAGSGDHDALDQTDSIVSLVAKDWHQVGERWKVTFDMSSLSDSQEIWLSELRFHDSVFSASTVELYHAHDSTPERSVLLGSIKITPSYSSSSSWKVFNITHLLTRWLHQGGEEQWHAHQTEDETDSVVEEGSGNEMTGTSPPHKIEDLGIDQVMIVVFLKSILTQSHQNSSTLMQTVQHSKYVVLNQSDNARRLKRNQIEPGHVQELGSENVTLSGTGSLQRPLCRRVDMWVDFDRIGWNEWIVHPKRYNAYRCEGECPVPLDESFKPTNHAYMQSLLKYHHPERVTCVSCVPKSLSSLSMLYYEGDDIVLHHHEDMIVEECSCQ